MEEFMKILSFGVIYLGVIVITTWFVKNSGINLFKFSIPMVVYWAFLVFAYIGYPALIFKWVPYYINIGTTDDTILLKMFLISSLVWIQFFAGMYLCSNFYKGPNDYKVNKVAPRRVSYFIWITLFALCVAVLMVYLMEVPRVAIIESFKGGTRLELARYRSDMTNNFPNLHRYTLFFKEILPFLSTIAFAQMLFIGNKSWKLLFVASFLLSSFSMVMDIQKAPIFWYVFSLIAVFLVYNNKLLQYKSILKYVMYISSAVFGLYVVFMGAKMELSTILLPITRALTGQIIPFYSYLETFPDYLPFQGGKTFPNPGGLLPFDNFRYTVEIRRLSMGEIDGIVGSSPTAFFGELWVNFGWALLFVTPIAFGALVYLVHILFCRKPLSSVGIALMIWMAFDLSGLAFTGFSRYFFPSTLMVLVSISATFYFWGNYKYVYTK